MTDHPTVVPKSEFEVDWNDVRARARQRMLYKLGRIATAELEDLVQEVTVGTLRAIRRAPVRDLPALLVTIADRTAASYIRRRQRWALILDPSAAGTLAFDAGDAGAADSGLADPDERVRFFVLGFFRNRRSGCAALAEAFFDERDWARVAIDVGSSHAAVRQRWSRCVAVLRSAVSEDSRFMALMAWARERC